MAIDGEVVPIAPLRHQLEQFLAARQVEPKSSSRDGDAAPSTEAAEEAQKLGLVIKTNVDGVDYETPYCPRKTLIESEFPYDQMKTNRPKAHQLEGFAWLVEAWRSGWPGVLLADDMGLGKTYQALAFLSWIRANKAARGRHHPTVPALGPIMVVAPTALLRNWRAEADRHLTGDRLGELVEAFGPGLRRLKRPKGADWSPDNSIDLDHLRSADWILTTYETLADNHRSFARLPYSIVVFDEMQKIKEPGSINTRSAKTLNVDFVIGLTGTPIENQLEDIWSIFDRLAPGYLGALRDFSRRYGGEDKETLQELKSQLDTPTEQLPAPMLRRMKDAARDGLPQKIIKAYKETMPAVQAKAYSGVLAKAGNSRGSRKLMLEILHHLRGVSLHPHRADDVDTSDRGSILSWIGASARLSKCVELLRGIAGRGDKAIVFIEDLAVQRAFAESMAVVFDLEDIPGVINGGLPGDKRQAIVDRFQEASPGFDLLLLSPRAAGLGLTITAATHVLHLSRWWNPAVEDQCNDRAYRIGQTQDVTVHVPLAVHPDYGDQSFDVKLNQLLERKRTLSRDMLLPPEMNGDLEGLFGVVAGGEEGSVRSPLAPARSAPHTSPAFGHR